MTDREQQARNIYEVVEAGRNQSNLEAKNYEGMEDANGNFVKFEE